MKTTNRWGHAKTWGTDQHTYPSKNVADEETLGKRTDVQGNCSTEKTVLENLELEPEVELIGISPGWVHR